MRTVVDLVFPGTFRNDREPLSKRRYEPKIRPNSARSIGPQSRSLMRHQEDIGPRGGTMFRSEDSAQPTTRQIQSARNRRESDKFYSGVREMYCPSSSRPKSAHPMSVSEVESPGLMERVPRPPPHSMSRPQSRDTWPYTERTAQHRRVHSARSSVLADSLERRPPKSGPHTARQMGNTSHDQMSEKEEWKQFHRYLRSRSYSKNCDSLQEPSETIDPVRVNQIEVNYLFPEHTISCKGAQSPREKGESSEPPSCENVVVHPAGELGDLRSLAADSLDEDAVASYPEFVETASMADERERRDAFRIGSLRSRGVHADWRTELAHAAREGTGMSTRESLYRKMMTSIFENLDRSLAELYRTPLPHPPTPVTVDPEELKREKEQRKLQKLAVEANQRAQQQMSNFASLSVDLGETDPGEPRREGNVKPVLNIPPDPRSTADETLQESKDPGDEFIRDIWNPNARQAVPVSFLREELRIFNEVFDETAKATDLMCYEEGAVLGRLRKGMYRIASLALGAYVALCARARAEQETAKRREAQLEDEIDGLQDKLGRYHDIISTLLRDYKSHLHGRLDQMVRDAKKGRMKTYSVAVQTPSSWMNTSEHSVMRDAEETSAKDLNLFPRLLCDTTGKVAVVGIIGFWPINDGVSPFHTLREASGTERHACYLASGWKEYRGVPRLLFDENSRVFVEVDRDIFYQTPLDDDSPEVAGIRANPIPAFSVAFRCLLLWIDGDPMRLPLFGLMDTHSTRLLVYVEKSTKKLCVWSNAWHVRSNCRLTLGTEYHIAFTLHGQSAIIYLDGQQVWQERVQGGMPTVGLSDKSISRTVFVTIGCATRHLPRHMMPHYCHSKAEVAESTVERQASGKLVGQLRDELYSMRTMDRHHPFSPTTGPTRKHHYFMVFDALTLTAPLSASDVCILMKYPDLLAIGHKSLHSSHLYTLLRCLQEASGSVDRLEGVLFGDSSGDVSSSSEDIGETPKQETTGNALRMSMLGSAGLSNRKVGGMPMAHDQNSPLIHDEYLRSGAPKHVSKRHLSSRNPQSPTLASPRQTEGTASDAASEKDSRGKDRKARRLKRKKRKERMREVRERADGAFAMPTPETLDRLIRLARDLRGHVRHIAHNARHVSWSLNELPRDIPITAIPPSLIALLTQNIEVGTLGPGLAPDDIDGVPKDRKMPPGPPSTSNTITNTQVNGTWLKEMPSEIPGFEDVKSEVRSEMSGSRVGHTPKTTERVASARQSITEADIQSHALQEPGHTFRPTAPSVVGSVAPSAAPSLGRMSFMSRATRDPYGG
eukprot:Rmarinus@m.10002